MVSDNMGVNTLPLDDVSINSGKIYLNFDITKPEDFKMIEKKVTHPVLKIYEYEGGDETEPGILENSKLLNYKCNDDIDAAAAEIDPEKAARDFHEKKSHQDDSIFWSLGLGHCSYLLKPLPKGLHILSISRDDYDEDMILLRLENFYEDQNLKLEKLSNYFNFSRDITQIQVVNLAGIVLDTPKYLKTNGPIEILASEVLTLRVYF